MLTCVKELLKDEHSEIDVAGPTLPALKAMLEPPSDPKSCRSDSKYGRLVHGLTSACLLHIDEMRYSTVHFSTKIAELPPLVVALDQLRLTK